MNEPQKILLVEDEPIVVDSASRILGSEGFHVDHVPDAEKAFEKIDKNHYRIIISDLMLPGVSGIEVVKKAKLMTPEIPIIIITGYANLENAIKSFKTGAFDFLPKPFDFEELIAVVFRALKYAELKGKSNGNRATILKFDKKQHQEKKDETFYFLGAHSWAKIDKSGVASIGVAESFFNTMGKINRIEMPLLKTEVWQGNLCVRIIAENGLSHIVWAPLSGQVIAKNAELDKQVELINTDPFGRGWLFKIVPTNMAKELENLDILK